MDLISRWPLRRRLAAAFGLVTLLITGFAVLASLKLSSIRAAVVEMTDDRYPKIDLARDIFDTVNAQSRDLRNAIVVTSVDQHAQADAFLRAVEQSAAANKERMEKLGSLINTATGREIFQAAQDSRAEFGKVRSQVVRLLQERQWQDAATLTMGGLREKQDTYLAALDKMIDFQQGLFTSRATLAKDLSSSTLALVVGVAAVVVVLSVALALVITRSVLGELGGEPAVARDVAQRIAGGDLTVSVRVEAGDSTSLFAALQQMQRGLAQTVARVRDGSESVATASAQIAQGNQDLSGRTEEQASALQQTAATMEQLGSTVRSNADSARQANQLAQAAARVAVQGGEVVGEVVTTMHGISESSRRIGDIIGVIDGIAFQTNILALNAAVEAARAGEQGRGFAVVASEVRSLAQRSAEAAREIKGLITRNVEQVGQGTSLVGRAGQTMEEVVGSIRRVSDIVGEISAATAEQSNGVQQVGDAVGQMDQVTQQNAALVEQSAAAAESLKAQAQQLVQAVAVFRLAGAG